MPLPSSPFARQFLDRALQQLGSHAIILLDPAGVIVGWLAGAERLFGYKSDEIIGQNVSVLFTSEDLQSDLSEWEQKTANASGESEDDRWQVRKDGGRIWASGTLTAVRDGEGRLQGFIKVIRNHTDLKFQVETLESRIESAQFSNQQQNNFISILAHELRNPLGTVSNAAEILKQSGLTSPDVTFAVGMISRQVEFMRRMIDDLLELARCSTGKIEIRRERLILQEIIHEAVETCRRIMDERRQTLLQLLPDASIHLNGDPIRLRQVFVNLIENAAKYTPQGGLVRVKATAEGEEAVVRVQDTGIGISPEVMPHIFELFTQADIAGRSQSGLGIGLSVVKETVTLHGGTVQATSDGTGKGSEFTVRLPLSGAEPGHARGPGN